MPSRRLLIASAVSVLATHLSAQNAPQPPVFRSGTDVVRLDVRVFDEAGRAITDLKADEIQITEGGSPRPVLFFQHVDEPRANYVEAAVRAVSAEVTSNQGSPKGHLYILVFDQHHITTGNEQRARRAAEAFINRRVRPSDRVAVYGIPGPGPQIGFTADRARAIAELQRVRAAYERTVSTPLGTMTLHEAYEITRGNPRITVEVLSRFGPEQTGDFGTGGDPSAAARVRSTGGEDPAVTQRLLLENARTVVAQADAEARQFLQRMADLIQQYRAIEGRKTVVLFSEGFNQQNVSRELELVAAAAAQSYSVFYALDLNRRESDLREATAPTSAPATEIQERIEPLGSLAVETDGMLVIDAASYLDTALDRLADQAQSYYIVGFEPAAGATRDSYRRVKVAVTRPGARVSTRTGYALGPDTSTLDRRRTIDAALAAPFVQHGVRVEYTTYLMRSPDARNERVFLALTAELPVRNSTADRADVVFVVRDTQNGRVAASGTDTLPLPARTSAGGATGTAQYRVHFELPPGTYLMRALVREPGGLVGSADRKIAVKQLTGPDISSSDLVLGSTTGTLAVRARTHVEDGLGGLVEIYGRASDQLDGVDVLIDLIPQAGDRPVASIKAQLDPVERAGTSVLRRARFQLPLSGVSDGEYVVRATVRDSGETASQVVRQVEVLGGAGPIATADEELADVRAKDILEGELVVRLAAQLRTGPQNDVARRISRGLDLFAREQFKEAASELQAVMQLDATNAATAFVTGWACELAGDSRGAISAWRAAASIDPHLIPPYLALAESYVRLKQPALAVQALQAGLKSVPDSLELKNRLLTLQKQP
jgi:VWFA-related protein